MSNRVELRLTDGELRLLDIVAQQVGERLPEYSPAGHRYNRKRAIVAALEQYGLAAELEAALEESHQRVVDAVNDILQSLGGRCYLDGGEVVVRAANREHRRKIG